MYDDPIVEEVRRNAEKIAKEVGYDQDRYIERLRQNQWKSGHKVVDLSKRKVVTKKNP
jgi:hypothetical protein